MAESDLIGVVEAAYDLEPDMTGWARNLCSVAHPLLDRGFGVTVHLFEPTPDGRIEIPVLEGVGVAPEVLAIAGRFLRESPPSMTYATHVHAGPCTSISEVFGVEGVAPGSVFHEALARFGVLDVMGLRALDVDGSGVIVDIPLPAVEVPDPTFRSRWSHVAAHLGAGYRLRRRLAGQATQAADHEAVLEPDGHCVHAEGEAKSQSARDALRCAVRQMEEARTNARSRDDEALAMWRALTEGRWSVLDRFDSDGRRFIIARKNEPNVRDPRGLGPREAQVASFAALGHPSRMIAYHLGLSEPTVANCLRSALHKLGLQSQVELVRLFQVYPEGNSSQQL